MDMAITKNSFADSTNATLDVCVLAKGQENNADTIYQPLHSGRIWHKVNF